MAFGAALSAALECKYTVLDSGVQHISTEGALGSGLTSALVQAAWATVQSTLAMTTAGSAAKESPRSPHVGAKRLQWPHQGAMNCDTLTTLAFQYFPTR